MAFSDPGLPKLGMMSSGTIVADAGSEVKSSDLFGGRRGELSRFLQSIVRNLNTVLSY